MLRTALIRAAAVALVATTSLSTLVVPTGRAAPALRRAAQTYTAPAFSLSYPGGWFPMPGASASAFSLMTGDRNAFLTITAGPPLNLGANPMPALFTRVLGQYGAAVAQPQFGTTTVRGVQVRWVSGIVRYGQNAHVGLLTVYLAASRTHTYVAAVGVVDTGSTAASIGGQEYMQSQAILNTLRFR